MNETVNEKLIENFVKLYPKQFIGENLKFISQQPNLYGFRPDLLFEDEKGFYVIVEIQLGTLNRNHLYRILEYRDLLIEQQNVDHVRAILICENVNPRHKKLLEIHNLEYIELSMVDFLKNAKLIDPELNIGLSKNNVNSVQKKSLYADKILKQLSKNRKMGNNNLEIDAVVFWTRSWDDYRDDFMWLKYTNLNDIITEEPFYYTDC